MTGSAILNAISKNLSLPWTVDLVFRTADGQEVLTWRAPALITATDQNISIQFDLSSATLEGDLA